MELLIIGAILGAICAALASTKGRSAVGWFFIGFFFGLFALIVILVVPNLKEAKEKEEHMKMEQKRLHEQLRQEQMKTERLRKYAQARLDIHDRELNIDTRHIGHLLEQGTEKPVLDHEQQPVDELVPIEPETTNEKIRTQCPHCQTRFKASYMSRGKEVVCPTCSKLFVVGQIADGMTTEECTSCGRTIGKGEPAYVSAGRIICAQCEEGLQR